MRQHEWDGPAMSETAAAPRKTAFMTQPPFGTESE